MPLRDHFQPPIFPRHSWEGFHGQWPAMLVRLLIGELPENYIAEPRVHLGSYFEIDVGGFENNTSVESTISPGTESQSSTAAMWTAPAPTATLETDPFEPYEYEVLVYDESRARRLVAAVEFVSPANKDRPETRRAFATKCAALIQSEVSVSIVDLVGIRQANLYAEMLELTGWLDPTLPADPPVLYAVTCRKRLADGQPRVESWAYPLQIGRPLPTLPLWLTEEMAVALDLEASYEETCRVLRIA